MPEIGKHGEWSVDRLRPTDALFIADIGFNYVTDASGESVEGRPRPALHRVALHADVDAPGRARVGSAPARPSSPTRLATSAMVRPQLRLAVREPASKFVRVMKLVRLVKLFRASG